MPTLSKDVATQLADQAHVVAYDGEKALQGKNLETSASGRALKRACQTLQRVSSVLKQAIEADQ